MAAGVFGMARTIAVPDGRASCRKRNVRPAMMESASVVLPTWARTAGSASGALCGFTAMTMAEACVGVFGLIFSPRRVSVLIALPGCGSSTIIFFGDRPRASQPSSMAWPILPAPSRTSGPGNLARGRLMLLRAAITRSVSSPARAGDPVTTNAAITRQRRIILDAPLSRGMTSGGYASPEVSNMAAASASWAPLPAQTTNWKALK